MANNLVKVNKWFSLHEYEKEEDFLREQSKKGLKLVKIKWTGQYTFEETDPEDYVYRLDFKQVKKDEMESYVQMYYDFGWEYVLTYNDYHYFRKAAQFHTEEDLNIFSDDESRVIMAMEVAKRKLLPLIIIVLCSIMIFSLDINIIFGSHRGLGYLFGVFWLIIIVIDVIQIFRCGNGLMALKRKYSAM